MELRSRAPRAISPYCLPIRRHLTTRARGTLQLPKRDEEMERRGVGVDRLGNGSLTPHENISSPSLPSERKSESDHYRPVQGRGEETQQGHSDVLLGSGG